MLESLSRKQRAVLERIALGESNKEIASALDLADGTVKAHVKRIIEKLNAGNRTDAARHWWRENPERQMDCSPDDLRAEGWAVAAHNDYRVDGVPHTFWLSR